jgi:general secretion pathway protein G
MTSSFLSSKPRSPRASRGGLARRSLNASRPTLRRADAFTLVELLLVLVILGILAALVLPKFTGRTEQARTTAAQTQISTFGTALDAFEVDTGTYPRGQDGLAQLISQPGDATNWRGPYLKSDIPLDPWGHAYIYEFPGKTNPTGYDIRSMGPDGQAGTGDDIVNARISSR